MYTKDNLPEDKDLTEKDILNPNYWLVLMVIIFVGGLLATFAIAESKQNYEINRLLNRAETISASIDTDDIKALTGTPEDLTNPSYLKLKKSMMNIKSVNPDIRFVYLMGRKTDSPDKLFFLVDSEPSDSRDYSAPGDIYEETSLLELNNFINAKSYADGPYKDKWGSWISSNAPIVDKETGIVLAKTGIDVNSEQWEKEIILTAMLPGSVTLCLTLISFLFYLSQKRKAAILRDKLEFISIASHQLRTPLTAIKWYSEAILKNSNISGQSREFLENIDESNERMIRLVSNLLEASYIDMEKSKLVKTRVDIREILRSLKIDMMGITNKQNVTINFEDNFPNNLFVSADHQKMRQVFTNLLTNSIKYSKSGGNILIGYKENKNTETISIKDFGIGIPKESQNRIFQRFFRADNARQTSPNGDGLGLYIAKDIILKHGGKIYFTSEEDSGTTFFIELPKIKRHHN